MTFVATCFSSFCQTFFYFFLFFFKPTIKPWRTTTLFVFPQFAVDPGADLDWARTEQNPAMLAQLQLQEGERLGLLREYLDLVQVPNTTVD